MFALSETIEEVKKTDLLVGETLSTAKDDILAGKFESLATEDISKIDRKELQREIEQIDAMLVQANRLH